MERQLAYIGVSEEARHTDVFRLIDRRDRMAPEAWASWALDIGLSEAQLGMLKTMLGEPDLWQ